MKKISFLLLFCALVFAQIRAEIARGTWGNGFSWEISNDSVLTVSGAGEMPVLSRQDLPVGEEPYTGGEINPIYPHFAGVTTTTPWYAHRKAVKQIVLQAGITSIAEYAFYKCKNLSGIQIPSSVTKIKEGAFGDCNGLQAIMFPSSVTSIGDDAFNFCSGLTRLTIPMSVKVIGHRAFLGCSNLANLTLAEGIETINSEAFRGLPLTSITIPASVKYIGNGVFNDCHALVNITVAGKTPAGIGADVWNYLLTANGASGEYPEFYRDAYSEAGWDLTKGVGKTALYVVPTGAAATYKKTVEWNKFFSTSAPIIGVDILPAGQIKANLEIPKQLTARVNPAEDAVQDVVWTSSDESIVQIDQHGIILGRKLGEVDITATSVAAGEKFTTRRVIVTNLGRDASLTGVKVNGELVTFGTDNDTAKLSLKHDVEDVLIEAIPTDPHAQIVGAGTKKFSLSSNKMIDSLNVTSEDGDIKKEYRIDITRLNGKATLDELLVYVNGNETPLKPPVFDFNPETNNYTLNLSSTAEHISISTTKDDTRGTVKIDGGQILKDKDNSRYYKVDRFLDEGKEHVYVITGVAEDGTTQDYYLRVRRMSDNCDLDGIMTGQYNLELTPSVTEYSISVPYADENLHVLPLLIGENTPKRVVRSDRPTGDINLVPGENKWTFTVTAEDPAFTKDYHLTITRMNNEAYLTGLTVNGTTIPSFSQDKSTYSYSLVETDTLLIGATLPEGINARVSGDGMYELAVGKHEIHITVTSQDGSRSKTYTLNVTRLNDDAFLTGININGNPLLGFDKDHHEYSQQTVPFGTESVTIDATAALGAKIDGLGTHNLIVGDNTIVLTVISESKKNTVLYSLPIRRLSGDASLKALTIKALTIDEDTIPIGDAMAVTVPDGVERVTIKAERSDSKASISYDENPAINYGKNLLKIEVTAEDRSITKTYYLTVEKKYDVETTLDMLAVDGYTLDREFDSKITSYSVSVDLEKLGEAKEVTFRAEKHNEKQTVSGSENISLQKEEADKLSIHGSVKIDVDAPYTLGTLIVVAQDNTVQKTYQIKFTPRREPQQAKEIATGTAHIGSDEVLVFANDGVLHVSSPVSENIKVYTVTGTLLRNAQKLAGKTTLTVNHSKGILLVKGSSGWVKKLIVD